MLFASREGAIIEIKVRELKYKNVKKYFIKPNSISKIIAHLTQ